jgi:hypothetical protein
MKMRVKVDPIPESLDSGDDTRDELFARHGLEISGKTQDGQPAELPEELPPELEEDPYRLRDREDDLAMRHVQKKRPPHPLSPLLEPLGMTGGTEAAGLAGECQ